MAPRPAPIAPVPARTYKNVRTHGLAAITLLVSLASARGLANIQAPVSVVGNESPESGAPETAPLEEVVVSGEQPGPGLWKVTHGSHVLWILGTVTPLPKGVQWHSRQVESVLASAKIVIVGESVTPKIGLFRAMTLFPSVLRARFNPDGAMLKDLISPEQYDRWLVLKKKYFDDDKKIERVRPMFIAMQMQGKAIEQAGLVEQGGLGRTLTVLAKKYKVPMYSADIKIELDDPKKAIRDFSDTPRVVDLECFNQTLDRFDSDLETMKLRANAWSIGDVEELRKLPLPVGRARCSDALTSAPALQGDFTKTKDKILATWLADAEKALANNEVSLAILSMQDVLNPSGKLAHLQERGYQVEAPSP